jgi:hypothetical protein
MQVAGGKLYVLPLGTLHSHLPLENSRKKHHNTS